MDNIIDTFVEAGYFRARISTLSDFDKIIGGMAWAMKVFSYDINIDVFYADSLDLGQKIALTERLVMVLLVIKCPFQIEPHQIVGLDYANLLPVIKWLIRRSKEVRREHEAFNRLLALRHYHRVTDNGVTSLDRSGWCHVVSVSDLKEHLKGKQHVTDASTGLDSEQRDKSVPDNDHNKAQPTAAAKLLKRINTDFKDNQQVSFVQLATVLRAAHSDADREAAPSVGEDGRSGVSRRLLGATLDSQLTSDEDESSDHDHDNETGAATGERQTLGAKFETQTSAQSAEDRAKQTLLNGHGEAAMSEQDKRMHKELDNELLATNQKILNLLKKLDSMPSQLEIGQYQRRYIELHQQLISKNKDVKKLYDLYNTLDVTKHYLVKEINLLDSISANLDLTTDSVSNRQLFLTQFNEIIGKIQQIREDMQLRLDRLRQKSDMLNIEYASLLEGGNDET